MENIIFSIQNGVGKITLNRPDVVNSMNMAMAKEVQSAFDECAANKTVRAILLTGAGRAFCAGQDLAAAMTIKTDIKALVEEQYNPLIQKIRNIEKPVICAVNGVAAGAGASIAIACDIVLAGVSATFIQAFSKIGLIPDSGATFILPRLVGLQRATALMFMGDKVSAQQAMEMGMIYKVLPDDTLMSEAEKLAEQVAQMPTKGLGLTKRLLNASMHNNLTRQLEMEAEIQSIAAKTSDNREGIMAFLEKRKPVFKGE